MPVFSRACLYVTFTRKKAAEQFLGEAEKAADPDGDAKFWIGDDGEISSHSSKRRHVVSIVTLGYLSYGSASALEDWAQEMLKELQECPGFAEMVYDDRTEMDDLDDGDSIGWIARIGKNHKMTRKNLVLRIAEE